MRRTGSICLDPSRTSSGASSKPRDSRRPEAPEAVRRFVRYGASPRAALGMAASARALALLRGKPNVGFDEVRDVADPVLNHRLVLTYEAALEKVSATQVVAQLLEAVPEVVRA